MTETCEDLGRGETATEEKEHPRQRNQHKEKPKEQKLGWDGVRWEEK